MSASKKQRLGAPAKVQCRSPVNIAVVKYWGKRNQDVILPINSSLSLTLHIDDLCSTTAVEPADDDTMTLNGKEEALNKRVKRVLAVLRSMSSSSNSKRGVRIVSHNNFPTAAGLASSASGYACLTAAVAKLWEIDVPAEELSRVARQGSGSACRSLMGGYVAWDAGVKDDGSDSQARQVATEGSWAGMSVLIAVVHAGQKEVASTSGMQSSVATSELLKHRAEHTVPIHMRDMEAAIAAKDFESFARLTMQESNQFHATCLDTLPPIHYLNPTSYRIISAVHAVNEVAGRAIVTYTFDAGPNAVLFGQAPDLARVRAVLECMFPHDSKPAASVDAVADSDTRAFVQKVLNACGGAAPESMTLGRLIDTSVGPGPEVTATY